MASADHTGGRIAAVRRFNRFYTRRIDVLDEGLLRSPFSLTEAWVLYELANREEPTASDIGGDLGLDAGYLSRLLRGFGKRGLIRRTRSATDGRRTLLALTAKGRQTFATLDGRSQDQVGHMLGALTASEQNRLIGAMGAIEGLLGDARKRDEAPCVLRPHRPGDLGWVVHRHGMLYADELGWDERFEAFVARIAAKFVENYDPKRERCWIAEQAGEAVGSVALVKQSKTTAKLRLLLVEPKARGHGIGTRLVQECVRFARRAGYRKITLWTDSVLHPARHIYEKAGFRLVREEPDRSFGHALMAQVWEMKL